MLTSPSSFALIGHRTLELYYYYYYYYFIIIIILFNLTVVRGRRSSEGRMKTEEKTKVSEVGFEPGTFRSCVEHYIHYATEPPPIPDVLLVLVAPKYINRNVTTTLQSRFTPTAPPHGHPALFAEVRTLPIFQQFSSKSLYFNMADLGVNVSDNIRCDVINSYLLTWRIWGGTLTSSILLAFLSKLIHHSFPDECFVEKECCMEMDR